MGTELLNDGTMTFGPVSERLWWVSQPETHSFYLKKEEYNRIQAWYIGSMDEEVIVFGSDILGEPHPTHSICTLAGDTEDNLGDPTTPVFAEFPYLKDVREKLKNFKH